MIDTSSQAQANNADGPNGLDANAANKKMLFRPDHELRLSREAASYTRNNAEHG